MPHLQGMSKNSPWPRAMAVCLGATVAPLAFAGAQGLMLRDNIVRDSHRATFDAARGRLLEVGRHGETRELDGASWLLRPGAGPRLYGGVAHRTAARRTFAFGLAYGLQAETWEHDGVAWQRLTPPVQPQARQQFTMTYDSLRDRVVVFSGFGMTGNMFADTWEWDGATWLQRATTGPLGRQDAAMAFDRARGRCVLFGGQAVNVGMVGDTWEWDGTTWTPRVFGIRPTPRTGPALGYDPIRARIVLHGGLDLSGTSGVSDQTWEYDGLSWQLVATGGGPGGRYQHDLVFDTVRNELLAVGGLTASNGASGVFAWNGTRWQAVVGEPSQPRGGYGMRAAADPVGGGAVMFGGATWRHDASGWALLALTAPPRYRVQTAMWSDGAQAWLFGGIDNILGQSFDETWRWNGTAWLQAFPTARPAPRGRTAVAFDSLRGRAVLFGGATNFGSVPQADTWEFDGVNWQQLAPGPGPAARHGHGLSFDLLRGRVVLFGGSGASSSTRFRDTWEWNGTAWAAVATAVQPPAYGTAAMAYDTRLARTVMTHAPSSGSLIPTSNEAWTYDGAAWAPLPLREARVVAHEHSLVQPAGSASLFVFDGASAQELVLQAPDVEAVGIPCDAQAPRLGARTWPEPGRSDFGIDVVAAPPLQPFLLGGSLTTATSSIGPCTLHLGNPLVVVLGSTDANGFASRVIPVPPQPALVSVQCWFQAAVFPPASAGGLSLSAALRIVVGE